MKSKIASKSFLLLMEICVMLLVFSLCAAICLRVFATARSMAESSRELDHAVLKCSTVAELYRADPSIADDGVELFFDRDFKECARDQAAYILSAAHAPTGLDIALHREDGREIYSLYMEAVTYE